MVSANALLIGALSLLSVRVALAEEGIVTDRPDFVESSDVVGKGHFQIEVGGTWERDDESENRDRTFTTPMLLRFGAGTAWELRVETDGRTIAKHTDENGSTTERGYSDVALGIKVHLTDADANTLMPSTAVLFHVETDSGSTAFRGEGLRPSLRVVGEWDLTERTAIGVMPGIIWDKNEEHRFISGIMAVTYGQQWTDTLHTFVEVSGQQLSHADDGGCIVTYDAGASYLLAPTTQVDVFVNRAANDNTPDWAYGIGLSLKF